eukprot:CAMPEP_0172505478 /NCGR_PEP_ID=MMETSP1066-20121228/186829_1 /TAXON_ID=671091 /ORGANISM="Coscinodiscus wailesii, Strain CCMP2513" /LENGTH=179 /DNA_ID=CAMNT_0013282095 /DNA_START=82 /DNA_END=621 /DNA_ORIENTATION=+
MSRAFTPPDTLSKDDIRTVADVRREVWTNGFKGMFFGTATGLILHTVAKTGHGLLQNTRKIAGDVPTNMLFNKNTVFLSAMIGGAVGSFSWATAAGKNNVHHLHDVFEKGKKTDTGTVYQQKADRARQEEIEQRQRNRLMRRQSLERSLVSGRGLSDSHGGHWLEEDEIISEREVNKPR